MFVSPPSLSVDSRLFKPEGADSETGSRKLLAEGVKSGAALEAQVSGEAGSGSGSEPKQAESETKVLPNPMTRLGVPLLACFLLAMLWAAGIRVAKEWPRWKRHANLHPSQTELEAKVDALFDSLGDLDELFAAGKMPQKQYWKERLELKACW